MEKICANNWMCYNQDAVVTSQPAYLCCINFTANASGDYIEVYEGRDATSGRKFTTVKGLQNRSVSFSMAHPVLMHRGIFVHISTSDAEYTITFRPVEYEDIQPEGE